MKFPICNNCYDEGVIPGMDALGTYVTVDGVEICGLCEKRVTEVKPYRYVEVRVRRSARDVYAVLPLTHEYLNWMTANNEDTDLTLGFYRTVNNQGVRYDGGTLHGTI